VCVCNMLKWSGNKPVACIVDRDARDHVWVYAEADEGEKHAVAVDDGKQHCCRAA